MSGLGSWDRERALRLAAASRWEPLDLSLGVPAEPPPEISRAGAGDRHPTLASYPLSVGSRQLRAAIVEYLARRFRVTVPISAVAACAGGKEFISTVPSLLRISRPDLTGRRDTALIPALGYPPYEFGARLAGLAVERMPVDAAHRIDVSQIPDRLAERVLYMWVNSPANPTGAVEPDLAGIVRWGRARGVVVLSDEAYAELTWRGVPRTALAAGLDGVLSVHSLSKRSNAPGLRVGFYAGDPGLVAGLRDLRRAAGLIAAEDSQRAATHLLGDDTHVAELQARTARRVSGLVELLNAYGLGCGRPDGGLFLWAGAPGGDGVAFAYQAAARAGLLVAPGVDYGPSAVGQVRFAAVREPADIERRLTALASAGCLRDPMTPIDTRMERNPCR